MSSVVSETLCSARSWRRFRKKLVARFKARIEDEFDSKIRSVESMSSKYLSNRTATVVSDSLEQTKERMQMIQILDRRNALKMGLLTTIGLGTLSPHADASSSSQSLNKAVVGRWFTDFWGKTYNPAVVDELAAPDMFFRYSLHKPRHGREDIVAFMHGFREAFPDLNFRGTSPLLADGDRVIGQWEGGGTHTGPAFSDLLAGSLPAASGTKIHFTGITILRLSGGKIVEEAGLDDGVTALRQLGLLCGAKLQAETEESLCSQYC